MRKCGKCNLEKDFSDFHKKKGGKYGLQPHCKSCSIARAKKHYQDNKLASLERMSVHNRCRKRFLREWVASIKAEAGCCVCGESDDCCLDFHHPNDDKDKGVSYCIAVKSLKRLVNEINKCVCVCSNCHRKIHAGKIVLDEKIKFMQVKLDDVESKLNELRGTSS